MKANDRVIAELAIDRRQAMTFEQIQEEVSQVAGVGIGEVKKTIDSLLQEGVVKQCVTPAHNVLEAPIVPGEITWAWYEKGDLWNDPEGKN